MNNNTSTICSMIRATSMAAALLAGAFFTTPALASGTAAADAGGTWLANKYPAVYGPRNTVGKSSEVVAPELDAGKAWLASKYPAVYGPRFKLHAETSTTVAIEPDAGKAWLASKYSAVFGSRNTPHGG